jgi:hypothetical protein
MDSCNRGRGKKPRSFDEHESCFVKGIPEILGPSHSGFPERKRCIVSYYDAVAFSETMGGIDAHPRIADIYCRGQTKFAGKIID